MANSQSEEEDLTEPAVMGAAEEEQAEMAQAKADAKKKAAGKPIRFQIVARIRWARAHLNRMTTSRRPTVADMSAAWRKTVVEGRNAPNPVLTELPGAWSTDKAPTCDVIPTEVEGPTLTLRQPAQVLEADMAADAVRVLLRKPLRLGETPTEQTVSVLLRDELAILAEQGVGTSLGNHAAYAFALALEARNIEADGYFFGEPTDYATLEVVNGCDWQGWLSGPRSFVERFPSSRPEFFRVTQAQGPAWWNSSFGYPVPPSVLACKPTSAQNTLVSTHTWWWDRLAWVCPR